MAVAHQLIGDPAFSPYSPRKVIAICGGGNAGHALSIVLSKRFDGDVVWLAGSDEKARLLRQGVFSRDGLQSTGVIVGKANRVSAISAEPAEIIPNADVVIIAVPAFAHASILKRISPHLKSTAIVGCLPSRSGFEFEATHNISDVNPAGRRIFGLQTLPWSTRVQEPGKVVNFGACKARVLMASLPGHASTDIAGFLTDALGLDVVPTGNFLAMTLGNPGQVVHPGIMYGLFSEWQGQAYAEKDVPLFYKHVSDAMGAFCDRLSSDILAVSRRIEAASDKKIDLSGVMSVHEWLKVSYPTQTADLSTAATCFRTGPLQHRKAPMIETEPGMFAPNFTYRYLSEDVPFGLAVVKAIAELAEVETPAVEAVVAWTQEKLGKAWLVDGAMAGPDARELPIPQNSGLRTLRELVDWYAAWA